MASSGGPGPQSSLLFFHKIHCGTMSIDIDIYLTPSRRTRSTRSSHNSQYCRPQTYSDALKFFFFPRTIPSVVAAEFNESARRCLCVCVCVFFLSQNF